MQQLWTSGASSTSDSIHGRRSRGGKVCVQRQTCGSKDVTDAKIRGWEEERGVGLVSIGEGRRYVERDWRRKVCVLL
jgi:hypothetical protein